MELNHIDFSLDIEITKITELPTVPEQTNMDEKNNSGNAPPVTLPKPRKIGAELKRHSFARVSNSSQSKSFAIGDNATVIKRSSEMMSESKNAPRSERSMSFDTQTPYFCRLPRSLSIELEETLSQCEMSLKESSRKSSVEDVIEEDSPISPILTIPEEVTEVITEIEHSPDVIAMKNEIAIERSKIELERKKLSDTIDEIENFDFDFDTLIKPTDENVFEESSQSQGNGVTTTSVVEVLEELPTSSPVTNELSVELNISKETSPENQSTCNESEETSIENSEKEGTYEQFDTGSMLAAEASEMACMALPVSPETPAEAKSPEEQTQIPYNEPSIENIRSTDGQLNPLLNDTTLVQVSEESLTTTTTTTTTTVTNITVEVIPSEETSHQIQTPSNETPEPLIEKKEMGSTHGQLDLQSDVSSITQVTEESSESLPVSTEIPVELLPSEETSPEIKISSNETREPSIEKNEMGSTDEQLVLQPDVSSITQVSEESSKSLSVSTEVPVELLQSEEASPEIRTPSNEIPEPLVKNIEMGSTEEQLDVQPDVISITQVTEKSSVSLPVSTEIPVELLPSEETSPEIKISSNETREPSIEKNEMGSTDEQLVLQLDVSSVTQVSEESSEPLPASTEIPVELLSSEETSPEIKIPSNETQEPLIEKNKMSSTDEQLVLQPDVSSRIQVSEESSESLPVSTEVPVELLSSEETSPEIKISSNETQEPLIEKIKMGSTDEQLVLQPDVSSITQVSEESSESLSASTEIPVELLSSEETSPEIKISSNETREPSIEKNEMDSTDEQLVLQPDVSSITQVSEESSKSLPVSTEIPVELLQSEEASPEIQIPSNETPEPSIEKNEIGSTDEQLVPQPDVTSISQVSEESSESLPASTEITVELLSSEETSREIRTPSNEIPEPLVINIEMGSTDEQLDVQPDVTSITQVTEKSSVSLPVSTEIPVELLPSEETSPEIKISSNETREPSIEKNEMGSTDEQLVLQPDVSSITQVSEESSKSLSVSTEVPVELLQSEEASPEIRTPSNEIPEPLVKNIEMGSTEEQLDVQPDVISITQVTEKSSVSLPVSTEIPVELLPSEETSPEIKISSNETREPSIEKNEMGSTDEQLVLQPDVSSITQVSEESSKSLPVSTEVPVELLQSEEASPEIRTPSNEIPEPLVKNIEMGSTEEQLDVQPDVTSITQVTEKSSVSLPVSTEVPVELLPSEQTSPEMQTPSNETSEPLIKKNENESTDGQSLEISTPFPMSEDITVETTEDSDVASLDTVCVASTEDPQVSDTVSLESTTDSVTKIKNESIDMSLSDFTAMITASDEKFGVNAPVLSTGVVIEPLPDNSQQELNRDVSQCGEEPSTISLDKSPMNSLHVQCEEAIPIENGPDTVSVEVLKQNSVQSELNEIDQATPCKSITFEQESAITQIENITDIGPSENDVMVAKRENEFMHMNVKSQADNKEISALKKIPLDQQSNIQSVVNGTLVDTTGSNEQIIESVTVDKGMDIQPLTLSPENTNIHKNLNGTMDKSPEVNNELPGNCANVESNCILSPDGEVGSKDLLLPDIGITERVIFV